MIPRVSVIIPTYNVEPYIGRAIQSVLSQSFRDFEIIVVDDCSQDGTVRVAQAFHDPRIRVFVNDRNRGPSFSRNRAIETARGEWIAVLDGDDWWDERRLEVLFQVGEQFHADVVCDDLFLIYDGDHRPWSTQFKENAVDIRCERTVSAPEVVELDFGPLKPLFRKAFLDRSGIRYREDLLYGEDFVFLFECLMRGALLVVVPEAMYYYVSRPGSLVSDKIRLFERTLETTRQLQADPLVAGHPDIVRALQRRERRIRDFLLYYRAVEPIKARRFGSALSFVFRNPVSLAVLVRTVPGVLYRRVLRWQARRALRQEQRKRV
ncbi:MAG: glycosyltransferase family 2 protein [Alicyclobacillaceae bacterium]|nr:glycosyltransferase family 2 protein [Alicyclobacillaceae bacterium]